MAGTIAQAVEQINNTVFLRSLDESATKQGVVLRLLSLCGWNQFDLSEVSPEYTVGNRRVDYALMPGSPNAVFIEVKRPSESLEGHQQQLLGYCFQEGVKLAALTNGRTWWLYLPLQPESWEQRRFLTIDLESQEPDIVERRFMEYLSKGMVTSGQAVSADEDGLENVSFNYQWLADDAEIAGATGYTYTLADTDAGKTIKVRVSFTDDADNEETLTSAGTAAVTAKPNSPAAGAPTITGTAQVGETLVADTSGIADEDGLENVSFSYEWLADDAEIAGATASTYTLADADEGKAIQVRVSFTDDADNDETLTSAATAVVKAPLTASLENTPDIHDGQNVFTFELRFSEEFSLSYKTLRDHAFTVSGAAVENAERITQGSNVRWRITVSPNGEMPRSPSPCPSPTTATPREPSAQGTAGCCPTSWC